MSDEQSLPLKMDMVRSIFESSKQFAMAQEDMKTVFTHLEQVRPEFRAAAYEAAAMGLTLSDLLHQRDLASWTSFLQNADAGYAPDVYTGLGCALAYESKVLDPFIQSTDPAMHYRILDGYGFYRGMFSRRQTVQQQSLPGNLNDLYLCYHDQGLGRSLWYTCAGDCEKIKNTIQKFPAARQAELWRGAGIAASYLGGSNEQRLSRLFSSTGEHQSQLATGAAISARARILSRTSGADMELVCRLWCHSSAEEAAKLAEAFLKELIAEPQSSYALWAAALDKQFVPSPRYQFSS